MVCTNHRCMWRSCIIIEKSWVEVGSLNRQVQPNGNYGLMRGLTNAPKLCWSYILCLPFVKSSVAWTGIWCLWSTSTEELADTKIIHLICLMSKLYHSTNPSDRMELVIKTKYFQVEISWWWHWTTLRWLTKMGRYSIIPFEPSEMFSRFWR